MERIGTTTMKYLTFKYPCRQPDMINGLLKYRPDLKEYYIYDTSLTSGDLLYQCKGGIGVTKEPYIVGMHNFIRSSTAKSNLKETWDELYPSGRPSKWKYMKARERFNERYQHLLDSRSHRDYAELYCLWASSSFSHRYKQNGYDGLFFPTKINFDAFNRVSDLCREKTIVFKKEKLFDINKDILNENVVIYFHFPSSYGVYGAGFYWTEKLFTEAISFINEYSSMGYKVCASAQFYSRGKMLVNYPKLFPDNFYALELEKFKDRNSSEIYLLNF